VEKQNWDFILGERDDAGSCTHEAGGDPGATPWVSQFGAKRREFGTNLALMLLPVDFPKWRPALPLEQAFSWVHPPKPSPAPNSSWRSGRMAGGSLARGRGSSYCP